MKANEIMVGDWLDTQITPTRREYRKVTDIYCDLYNAAIWYGCEIRGGYNVEDAAPIPLTMAILNANGFIVENGYMVKRWNNRDVIYADGTFDNQIIVAMCGEKADYANFRFAFIGCGMPLQYVHELQHTLRLLGKSDLADNFKLE